MTTDRSPEYLTGLVQELCKLPAETEWVEFKQNNADPQDIGEYLSALANSAALCGKAHAYLVWGIENNTHAIIGTTFSPQTAKVGNEELENWLLRLLAPKINFRFYPVEVEERPLVLLEIGRAFRHPVQFQNQEFIRVGSYKKKLKDFQEKERLFSDRIEITNPGEPLVDPRRFVDTPPKSRNEVLASFMRRFNICEERGSGIDKVIRLVEAFQLPAPIFEVPDGFKRSVLVSHRPLTRMDRADRVRAVYQHACLRYVSREQLTNASVRARFGIEPANKAAASRLIRDALDAGVIRLVNEDVGDKLRAYLPFWA